MQPALKKIFDGIGELKQQYPHRKFTIDGRLVGDIGEIIAEINYELTLDKINQAHHDATTFDNRRVQIKATFQNSLTFKGGCDYYLGFKLSPNGDHEEVYNGPATLICKSYSDRGVPVPTKLKQIGLNTLRRLSNSIEDKDRILKRQK